MKKIKKPITKEQQQADLICLRKLKYSSYVEVYKVIQKTVVLKADTKTKRCLRGWRLDTLVMEVTHATGSFCFPLWQIFDKESQNVELRRIFFNILGLHKSYIAPVAPYPPFKVITGSKMNRFVNRLKAA